MHVRLLLSLTLALTVVALAGSQADAKEVKLARHPDYHNGKIAFSYMGDIWLASEDGANPQRLTVHTGRDVFPRFSPDGQWIAFSSNRQGGYEVFIMPAAGGTPKQLTWHSASDMVVGWTRDSKKVIFSSSRGLLYPGITNLYEVPIDGGLEQPLPTDWGYWGSYSPDGKRLAFNRHPGSWSRKHYRGSFAADLWVLDVEGRTFKRIVDNDLPDEQKPSNFWPMYGSNGEIYFVSDRDVMGKAGSPKLMTSTSNIWKVAEYGGVPKQLTKHTSGSLFFPSMSSDGKVIVYEENFGIWKLDVASGESKEIKINLASDEPTNSFEVITVNGEADNYHLSPTGLRAVIATNGDLFTIATDRGDTRRLVSTAGARDGDPRWSPDGKWIAFISDRTGREEVWVCDEFGKQLKQLSDSDCQKGTPQWSPDSKSLLYSGSDKKLYRYDFEVGATKTIAQADVIGFGGFAIGNPQWSPDGKWVSFTKSGETLLPHVYVMPATGGEAKRITDDDVYSDTNAIWTPDGKRIVYTSGSDIGNIGGMGRSTAQIHVVSLMPEEKAPADKSIDSEEEAVKAERERRRTGFGRRGEGDGEGGEQPMPPEARGPERKVEVKIDFNRMARRTRQVTRTEDNIGAMAVSPDSKTLVFVTSGTEGGRPVTSIWSLNLDDERQTRVAQASQPTEEGQETPRRGFGFGGGISSLQFAKDGRSLFYRQRDGIYTVSVPSSMDRGSTSTASSTTTAPPSGFPRRGGGGPSGDSSASTGSSTPRRISFTAKVEIDHRERRKQVFAEAWRVMKHRFYDPQMHGVNWNEMKARYEALVEHVGTQDDLYDLGNMLLGELNASHTGVSGGGRRGGPPTGETSRLDARHPGFEVAAENGFYKVTHIYENGPADKDWVKLGVGDYVIAIDDQPLKAGDNYWKRYALAPGNRLEFTVNSKPAAEGAWKVKITPASSQQVSGWQYDKWVDDRRAMVDKLSNGQIGYLHIRQMNESSLRQFERDLGRQRTKKALIIDQRFNPGGNIDQELLAILQQKQYQYTRVRDSNQVTRPLAGFFGPMVVLANERSTSDAEVFPDGFRTLKLGKIVGVTTYGAVIGTGSYTLMDGSSIRTPGSGLWNVNGTNLENYGVPPDVYVDNTPEDFLKGRDAQLEKAVEVLKEQMRK
jgi:tricorn protease